MTAEQKRRTEGLAIASLVCGLFFIIPILGAITGVIAIILGIIALVQISKNKETLKGNGMAISGIIMGTIGIIIIPIIALLAAIAIPNLLRARVSANDALAQSTLRSLSVASEKFSTANEGSYPESEFDLTGATSPYLGSSYCDETIAGYTYSCNFAFDGYEFTAAPERAGATGSAIFSITTGGITAQDKVTYEPSD